MGEQAATDNVALASEILSDSNLVRPIVLRVAVSWKIFDHIREGGSPPHAIVDATGLELDTLRPMLTLLQNMGYLREDAQGTFWRTAKADVLMQNDALQRLLSLDSAMGEYDFSVVGLPDTLRTGCSYFENKYGVDFWTHVCSSPKRVGEVASGSSPVAVFSPEQVSDLECFSSPGVSVLDVGGGNGNMLAFIASRHPALRGAVFELPERCASAVDLISSRGLDDRLSTFPGSFLEAVPVGFDVYLLNSILADWRDSDCVRILRNLAKACDSQATLVITEVNPFPRDDVSGSYLKMLCAAPGRVRSYRDVVKLAEESGLRLIGEGERDSERFTLVFKPYRDLK